MTVSYIDIASITDCRSSEEGGPHSAPNFRSDHLSVVQFQFADGSVRSITDTIDAKTYRALSTIAGTESIDSP